MHVSKGIVGYVWSFFYWISYLVYLFISIYDISAWMIYSGWRAWTHTAAKYESQNVHVKKANKIYNKFYQYI